MNDHKPKCKCAMCSSGLPREEALEEMRNWQNECVSKFGFYVHYVNEGEVIDVHTHGLVETHDHPDLQIVLPIDPKTSHSVINNVVAKIEEGQVFSDGMVVEDIIQNFSVKFVDAKEGDRDVLRIILPDPQGKIEPDEIDAKYAIQYGVKPKWTAYKGKK